MSAYLVRKYSPKALTALTDDVRLVSMYSTSRLILRPPDSKVERMPSVMPSVQGKPLW